MLSPRLSLLSACIFVLIISSVSVLLHRLQFNNTNLYSVQSSVYIVKVDFDIIDCSCTAQALYVEDRQTDRRMDDLEHGALLAIVLDIFSTHGCHSLSLRGN